jgi:CDP-glycerol glycerophosphotransferase (TagB/SpsB family)
LSSNPHSTLVWEHAYPGTYTTLEYGYPRNDRLAMASSTEVESVRAMLGLPPEGRVLLYAPTHREYEPGFRPLLDVERLSEELGPDWTVLARAHYFYRNEGTASSGPGGVLDVTDHPSIEDLCLAADVLVTDYSSLMFDYAVLDRPIVIFAPDWETYRTKRGVYFDLLHEAPGVVCRTAQELAATLASGEYETEAAGSARKVFRERFCGWEDGHASERVVRRVLLGETPGDPPG